MQAANNEIESNIFPSSRIECCQDKKNSTRYAKNVLILQGFTPLWIFFPNLNKIKSKTHKIQSTSEELYIII